MSSPYRDDEVAMLLEIAKHPRVDDVSAHLEERIDHAIYEARRAGLHPYVVVSPGALCRLSRRLLVEVRGERSPLHVELMTPCGRVKVYEHSGVYGDTRVALTLIPPWEQPLDRPLL